MERMLLSNLYPIAAGLLGRIECVIGAPEHLVQIVAVAQLRDPHAGGNTNRVLSRGQHYLRDRFPDAFRQAARASEIGFDQEDHKLLSAVAPEDIDIPDLLQATLYERLQHPVTLRMAERVVDLLEVIDVQHDHGQRMAKALRAA